MNPGPATILSDFENIVAMSQLIGQNWALAIRGKQALTLYRRN
jgi:hypothetical protein